MEPQSDAQNENTGDTVIIEEKVTKTNGEIVIKKYSRGKALGRGGFAKCYEVTNLETKKVLAAKIIPKSTLNRSRAKQKVFNFTIYSSSPKSRSTNLSTTLISLNSNMCLKTMKMYTSCSRYVPTTRSMS